MGRWALPAADVGRLAPTGRPTPADSPSTSASRSACSSCRRGSESGAATKRSSAAGCRSAPEIRSPGSGRRPREPAPRPGSGRRLPPLPAANRPPCDGGAAREVAEAAGRLERREGRVAGRRLADPVVVLRRRLQLAALGPEARLRRDHVAAQDRVDRLGHVAVDDHVVALHDLDHARRTSAAPCAPGPSSACRAAAPPRRRASPAGCRRPGRRGSG